MAIQSCVQKPFVSLPGARLSEGCSYVPENNSLVWIDVVQGTLHRLMLDKASDFHNVETLKVDTRVGVIGLTSNPDIFVCGVMDGIGLADFSTKSFKLIKEYPVEYHAKENCGYVMRSNDGSVDPEGNFWVGTMCDFSNGGVHPVGKLYQYDSTKEEFDVKLDDVTIPNGINWFKGNVYFTDSFHHKIYKYKCDPKTNEMVSESKEVFVDIAKIFENHPDNEELLKGEPDGSCMDQEGNLYIAVWGTGRVIKVNLKGELVEEIHVPAKRVSCVTIGGSDMNQLFITTASLNLEDPDSVDSKEGDLGGCLFKHTITTKGVPKTKWSQIV